MKKRIITYIPGLIILFVLVIAGLFVYDDYGVSWDEPAQHLIGEINYKYVFEHDKALLTFADKEYGAGFELPLIFIEKVFNLTDARDIYLARHLVTHLFFLFSAFCIYVLTYNLFRKQFLACLAFIMLALAPRLYAHSFFNTKDLPFLSMIAISFLVFHTAFKHKKLFLFLLLGISAGYSTGIRIMGILPAFFILSILVFDIISSFIQKTEPRKAITSLLLFLCGFIFTVYTVWPFLWVDSVNNFVHCINKMTHKEFAGYNLFMGKGEPTNQLPWTYLPVWFSITTPPGWVVAGLAGTLFVIVQFVSKPLQYLQSTRNRNFVFYLFCFAAPSCAVVFFHSVIYDEWRHLFFIYPAFVMLTMFFIDKLLEHKWNKPVQALCLIQVMSTVVFMVSNHPFQHVYFNRLVSHDREFLRKNYEFDYWGVSVKQALETLLVKDTRDTLKIYNPDFDLYIRNNVAFLPERSRKRIKLCTMEECEYFITTYRYHPKDFEYPMFYSIEVLNSSVVSIFKVK